jgi:hypothetical protein
MRPPLLALTAGALLLLPALHAAPLAQLKVLYIGDASSPRAREFQGFLQTNVAKVEVTRRKGFDPKQAAPFDVVLLDWPQGQSGEEFPPVSCSLGERAAWNKPTVLLGSAGLHVAIAWKGRGGVG